MAGAPEPKSESRMSMADDNGVGRVVDPTKNVLDLVRAESKYQDFAREAVAARANDLRAAETRRVDQAMAAEGLRQDQLRVLEAKRSDDLRELRASSEMRISALVADFQRQQAATTIDFQKQIAAILAAQTSKDALLLSQAVDKLGVTTGERLSAVEKNQYVTGGQAAVRDPALADTLAGIAQTLKVLSIKSNTGEGRETGRGEIIGYIALAVAVAGGLLAIFARFATTVPVPGVN